MDSRLRKTQPWNEKFTSDDEDEQPEKSQPKRTLSWNDKLEKSKQEASKFAPLRQRRKSIAPDMSLPPIVENKDTINNSSRKPQSVSSGREVSFNRASRRASVASTTSLYDHWSAASTESSLDSVLRRGSWANKPSATSRGSFNRRGPITKLLAGRPSFRTIGTRVTTLLRAKNAFARLKRKPVVKVADTVEKTTDLEIKELPKHPRFASTLSAEAQYAIMKGYEDVVHNYLCNTYPEYRNMLRRSRTPQGGVKVKPGEKENKEEGHKNGDTTDGADQVDGQEENQDEDQVVTSTPLPGDSASPRSHISPNHLRRIASSPDNHLPRSYSRIGTTSRNLARYNSLPSIAPSKDRQLMMTYRYQCAMDILDNIKQKMGLHPLSPRMKAPKATPVKEFNSWSYNWNNEFEVK